VTALGLSAVAWLVFVGAALLEVGGDATIRQGLRGGHWTLVGAGCTLLAAYGLLVNAVRWDLSRLLGVYVAVFALVSVLVGRLVLQEVVPASTWLGVGIVVVGGAVIQFGPR
jgi:drug/metabolite transporter superfamily protein YnfA